MLQYKHFIEKLTSTPKQLINIFENWVVPGMGAGGEAENFAWPQ